MYREEQLRALLQGRRILLAGYGREGKSAERLIRRLLPDEPPAIADGDSQIAEKAASGKYNLIVKSPGVPMRLLPRDVEITSLTDIFLQVYSDRVVGVSGTKGKSTTASLIHHLLPGSLLAGNIGVPLFDIIDDIDGGSVVVAELSCHQLEVLHRGPHIGVLLNLYQEHLDHYESYAGYKMAKMQMVLKQRAGDHFFYCTANEELCSLVERGGLEIASQTHPYALDAATGEERDLVAKCPLAGDHNRSNALVALRVASLVARQPVSSFREALATFRGLRHRLERVGEYGGITWYDDSISTIPEAAIAAVKALRRVDTLIVGGYDRGIDYMPLVEYLRAHPVGNLVFVGQAGRRIHALTGPVQGVRMLVEDDYGKIVGWCAQSTPKGGVVLLSPAAASYDSFKNFEERGDYYAARIKEIEH